MRFQYHKDGTTPPGPSSTGRKWVFVFGSNKAGIHGAGAAGIAHRQFYASWGKAEGWTSLWSYGIPTKDYDVHTTLTLSEIRTAVDAFASQTYKQPDLKFFVVRVGCGLAGYKDSEIAPLFADCNPENCSFAENWAEFLEPQLAPVLKKAKGKRGDNTDVLAFLRGEIKTLFSESEAVIRNDIEEARQKVQYLTTQEVPRIKKAIRDTSETLNLLREVSGKRDDQDTHQTSLVALIQTLNKVRRSQSDDLIEFQADQVFNKTALNTLMRERERLFPSSAS